MEAESRRSEERRGWGPTPGYPFFDSNNILVREDRRRAPDRRLNGIQVAWQSGDPTKTLSAPEQAAEDHETPSRREITPRVARILLNHKDCVINFNSETGSMVFGRAPKSDVVLTNTFTSRVHVRIEFINDRPVLSDFSKNGTYVYTPDGKRLYLNKRKLALQGSGVLGFGLPPTEPGADTIQFTCL